MILSPLQSHARRALATLLAILVCVVTGLVNLPHAHRALHGGAEHTAKIAPSGLGSLSCAEVLPAGEAPTACAASRATASLPGTATNTSQNPDGHHHDDHPVCAIDLFAQGVDTPAQPILLTLPVSAPQTAQLRARPEIPQARPAFSFPPSQAPPVV